MTRSTQRRVAALLGGVSLAMASLVVAESATQPARLEEGKGTTTLSAAGREPTALPASAAKLPALAQLQETVDRPLFLASRRPPEPAPAPSAEPPAEDDRAYGLVGVLLYNARRIALIKTQEEQRVLRIREGQRLDNWRVARIEPDRVLLSRDDLTRVLRLVDRERQRAKHRPNLTTTGTEPAEPRRTTSVDEATEQADEAAQPDP